MRASDASVTTYRRSRAAVTATFATHAVMSGSLGPWIPRLKRDNGLDPAGLSLPLTGYAVGFVLGTRLAGPALRRFGSRTVVRIGIPALAGGLALLPVASGAAALTAIFVGFWLRDRAARRRHEHRAVAVQGRFGRRLMSSMHGTWSVSVFAGAALGSGGVAAGIPLEVHFPVVAGLLVLGSFPLLRWSRSAPCWAGQRRPSSF